MGYKGSSDTHMVLNRAIYLFCFREIFLFEFWGGMGALLVPKQGSKEATPCHLDTGIDGIAHAR